MTDRGPHRQPPKRRGLKGTTRKAIMDEFRGANFRDEIGHPLTNYQPFLELVDAAVLQMDTADPLDLEPEGFPLVPVDLPDLLLWFERRTRVFRRWDGDPQALNAPRVVWTWPTPDGGHGEFLRGPLKLGDKEHAFRLVQTPARPFLVLDWADSADEFQDPNWYEVPASHRSDGRTGRLEALDKMARDIVGLYHRLYPERRTLLGKLQEEESRPHITFLAVLGQGWRIMSKGPDVTVEYTQSLDSVEQPRWGPVSMLKPDTEEAFDAVFLHAAYVLAVLVEREREQQNETRREAEVPGQPQPEGGDHV